VLDERWPRDEEGKPALPALRTFSLGAFSRATAAVVFCPITVVKTRMEYGAVSGVRYRNTLHALVTIGRQERLRGLFSGLGPTLLRDAPYSGLYLVMFTHLRDRLDAAGYSGSPHLSFLAGALAGSLATFATHPPDVVRTRLQLRHNLSLGGGGGGGGGVPPPPLPTSYAAIVRQEGLRALWTGVTPRIARRTLQQGMTWTIFEWFFGGRIA
jgi:solute carrier family 25, member 38